MSCFPHFDFVRNVAIDVMHGLYGGVTKALVAFWFDSGNHSNPSLHESIITQRS